MSKLASTHQDHVAPALTTIDSIELATVSGGKAGGDRFGTTGLAKKNRDHVSRARDPEGTKRKTEAEKERKKQEARDNQSFGTFKIKDLK